MMNSTWVQFFGILAFGIWLEILNNWLGFQDAVLIGLASIAGMVLRLFYER